MKRYIVKFVPLSAAFLMLATASAGLSGCARQTSAEVSSEAGTSPQGSLGAEENSKVAEDNVAATGNSGTMVETGNSLYLLYNLHDQELWRINKSDGLMEKLYMAKEGEQIGVFWIYHNNLYFSVGKNNGKQEYFIHKLDMASKKAEQILNLASLPSSLYAYEGVLYVKGFDIAKGVNETKMYALNDEGNIDAEKTPKDAVYEQIPEGCYEAPGDVLSYLVNRLGYMPLTNGENLVIADADGKNARSVPEVSNAQGSLFAEDAFYSVSQGETGKYICRRFDINTLEPEVMFETDSYPSLMQFRGGKLYYRENDYNAANSDSKIYEMDVKTKIRRLAAEMASEPGSANLYSYTGNFYVTEDAIYCQKLKEYGVYIYKASLKVPDDMTFLEKPLYQSKIKDLGTVEAHTETITCADGEKTAGTVYVEQLTFKGNSQAAEAMNKVMEEAAKRQIESSSGMVDTTDEAWIHDENYSESSLIYLIGDVNYLDDNYCCIEADSSLYLGGAHGTPDKEFFIFDRKTGARLGLKDIVNNTEEELKVMVSDRFKKLAEETGFSFESPEDLQKTVAERTDYDSLCYITEDGIAFYYTPYDIASYAAGFPEVVIPYEELDLKIPLGK